MAPDCWPMHPQPLPDELFSSWILRAASANGAKFYTLCHQTAPNFEILHEPLDQRIKYEDVALYAEKLRTSKSRAYETTLLSYEGFLFDQKLHSYTHGILKPGMRGKGNYFCLQYCPLCLSEGAPYFRKRWRVSYITVCTKHGIKLRDRCPECQAHIDPVRNDIKKGSMPFDGDLTKCFKCHFDLKSTSIEPAPPNMIADTIWYEQALNTGYVTKINGQWLYSFLFFAGLKQLMIAIIQKAKHEYPEMKELEIDGLHHEVRYLALCKLSGVFDSWPEKFIAFCQNEAISYSNLHCISKRAQRLPFWLENEFQQHAYHPNVRTSEESILTAIHCMKRAGLLVNKTEICRFMGLSDSKIVRRVVSRVLSKK